MADIELVIKISEKDLKIVEDTILTISEMFDTTRGRVYRAIVNGIQLPKGHGRLIDADKLKDELDTITEWNGDVHRYVTERGIDYAPTVIEADTESEG